MKFCDEKIQKHLLSGGKIKRKLGSCNIIANISENGFIYDNSKTFYIFCKEDLTADNWEIVEPEYNWDKIIKDRILCQFWDDDEFSLIGTLIKIGSPEPLFRRYKYQSDNGRYWINCRPVRKDEVIFYKDKK